MAKEKYKVTANRVVTGFGFRDVLQKGDVVELDPEEYKASKFWQIRAKKLVDLTATGKPEAKKAGAGEAKKAEPKKAEEKDSGGKPAAKTEW